jgi:RNA recognition motif-containing protein
MSDESLNKRQLFVRNLSFDATEEDLTKAFEDIGPLKNVTIAKKKNNDTPAGFGFVKL